MIIFMQYKLKEQKNCLNLHFMIQYTLIKIINTTLLFLPPIFMS